MNLEITRHCDEPVLIFRFPLPYASEVAIPGEKDSANFTTAPFFVPTALRW